MNNLLTNPAIQSGIIPFVVALIAAWALRRAGWVWSGLGFAIAYYTSVYLAAGFQFTPLTSTRKILILGVAAIAVGLLLDFLKPKPRYITIATVIAGAIAVIWVIWPVLARQEGANYWIMLVASLIYTGWIAAATESLRNKTDQGAMVALALGLGTGVSAMLGSSALLGQLGIAIGAVGGAYLLLQLFKQPTRCGSSFTLPIGLLSGLLATSAVLYAKLPWYSLLPLALIPLTAYIPVRGELSKFKQLLLLAAFTLPLTLISIVITWTTGSSGESIY
ncbi:MAG TPA: hypothetical protein VIM41_16920 [Gammaproteobacteria bacterium]